MSLTPENRRKETVDSAISDGMVNALLVFIPTLGGLAIAMRNPGFLMRTNWQSRTAIAIMPALFAFGLTSENSLSSKMHQLADKARHTEDFVHWAERKYDEYQNPDSDDHVQTRPLNNQEIEQQLADMYLDSVNQEHVKIVPGDKLKVHHRVANYVAAHPIKVLSSLSIPCIATIFYGQTGKEHLDFSVKILHTRVFGQFATLSLLMGVMGFKEYMDSHGKFVTQAEADARVEQMKSIRSSLMQRLAMENRAQEKRKQKLQQAHEETLKEKRKSKSYMKQVVDAAT